MIVKGLLSEMSQNSTETSRKCCCNNLLQFSRNCCVLCLQFFKLNDENFELNQYEIEILKKISEWPQCVEISSSKLEPHRIPFYLYDLATLFHSYWSLGNENKKFRFVLNNKSVNNSRLLLLQALSIVIKNGMSILGVTTPKSM